MDGWKPRWTNGRTLRVRTQRPPIVVTGVPRSGTTWLARALSTSPGTALTGREPMNPRGSQYALGGTLSTWTRLTGPTQRQARLLSVSYRGLNPLVYSRYGHHQWLAAAPHIRVIVKDPFAMLSLPAVVAATKALPLLVYRHPAAVLASYRRMGWRADLDEIRAAIPHVLASLPQQSSVDNDISADAILMGRFWSALNSQALHDLETIDGAVVVSHEDVAKGGAVAMQRLFDLLGLRWNSDVARTLAAQGASRNDRHDDPTALHNFNRAPEVVSDAWRATISDADLVVVERLASGTMQALDARRTVVG